ncbi:Sec1-like protein [Polychytrium aggregatum]|uniref:Sec1-like protein n=1 Tax=Polychytrium aggregatum TaxID=110093 RepID=UPI0022FECCC8|nr:Sec1-like protein [Polychytrium aggregatum]KAI9207262.1 Sec1-like protein [Polychytrium aggregatum]
MSSIRDMVRRKLLQDMLRFVQPPKRYKILIVDPVSLKILSGILKQHELTNENVMLTEDIHRSRSPYPEHDAIYFITPTDAVVSKIIDDFTPKPSYAAAHIFCTSPISDALVDRLTKSPARQYLKNLKDSNVDFLAIEQQIFSLDLPGSLYALYNPPSIPDLNSHLHFLAKRMTSVLTTLGDYPSIRYHDPSGSNCSLSFKFASYLKDELDETCKNTPDFPAQNNFKKPILIILDRSVDVMAPVLHEFTYQAMMNDLLTLEDGKYRYRAESSEKANTASLDDRDPIWMLIRHWHFAEAVDYIRESFSKFLSENKAAANAVNKDSAEGSPKGIESLKDMKDTLAALPQFQEMKSKFSAHINICQECQSEFSNRKLASLAAVEQDLACGETADGNKPRNIMLDLVPVLDKNGGPTNYDKLRVLMLYIIASGGIQDMERRKLLEHASLSLEESQAITNLSYLGVRLSANSDKPSAADTAKKGKYVYFVQKKEKKKKKRKADDQMPYELSRYVPLLKLIMEDQIMGCVDPTSFPWATSQPNDDTKLANTNRTAVISPVVSNPNPNSLRTTRASWANKKSGLDSAKDAGGISSASGGGASGASPDYDLRNNGPRIIVFVLGGITFSEIRSTYELVKEYGRDIVLGSTHILNPTQFVNACKELHKPQEVPTGDVSTIGTASVPASRSNMALSEENEEPSHAAETGKKKKGVLGVFKKKDKSEK